MNDSIFIPKTFIILQRKQQRNRNRIFALYSKAKIYLKETIIPISLFNIHFPS